MEKQVQFNLDLDPESSGAEVKPQPGHGDELRSTSESQSQEGPKGHTVA